MVPCAPGGCSQVLSAGDLVWHELLIHFEWQIYKLNLLSSQTYDFFSLGGIIPCLVKDDWFYSGSANVLQPQTGNWWWDSVSFPLAEYLPYQQATEVPLPCALFLATGSSGASAKNSLQIPAALLWGMMGSLCCCEAIPDFPQRAASHAEALPSACWVKPWLLHPHHCQELAVSQSGLQGSVSNRSRGCHTTTPRHCYHFCLEVWHWSAWGLWLWLVSQWSPFAPYSLIPVDSFDNGTCCHFLP